MRRFSGFSAGIRGEPDAMAVAIWVAAILSLRAHHSAMAQGQRPQGQRYTHVYVDRGRPETDSATMRRRLAAAISGKKDLNDFGDVVPKELGVDVPWGSMGHDWVEFFRDSSISVVLDTITVAHHHLVARVRSGMYDPGASEKLRKEVERIFAEENVGYQIDPQGGIHPLVDAEFDANRRATISALRGTRYANVLNGVEKAQGSLSEIPPDGKDGIRNTFAAAEGLFKLMFPTELRLTASALGKQLGPLVQRAYGGNSVALRSASKLVTSFGEWVDAAHNYRHEPGSEEIAQPPFDLAVNMVSLGNSFIRWLAELDAKQLADKDSERRP